MTTPDQPEQQLSDAEQAAIAAGGGGDPGHVQVPGPLFMRPSGDTRNDAVVKLELFDEHIRDHYDVAFALDDRDRVVAAYRSIGLTVMQVAEGSF